MGGDDVETGNGLCSTIPELLSGCWPGKECEILSGFMHRHSAEIARECKGRNLFISESLGGMGVPLPLGWKTEITITQRAVATRKWREQPYLHWGGGPARGPDLIEAPQPLAAPWLAGLHFDEEDGEIIAIPKEKRERRLEIGAWEATDLRRRNTIRGLLGDGHLFLPVTLCNFELRKAGQIPPRPRRTGNPFRQRYDRDWMSRDFEKGLEEYEFVKAAVSDNPWFGFSRNVRQALDWLEFTDGILTSSA
jgi:hypothetical protein